MLFQAGAFAAQPLKAVSSAPDDKLVQAFSGKEKSLYYSFTHPDIKKKALIFDRILDGFEDAPRRLTLPNSVAIYWGSRHKEATTQSVVISGPEGRPRLLAAVDSVPWCDGWHCEPFTSKDAYQAHASSTFLYPGIAIFVRDKRDLDTYLPYLKRWLQADLLGFNVECKKPRMAEACKFVTQTEWLEIVPTRAYLLPSMRLLGLPKVKAAEVPLEAFTQ